MFVNPLFSNVSAAYFDLTPVVQYTAIAQLLQLFILVVSLFLCNDSMNVALGKCPSSHSFCCLTSNSIEKLPIYTGCERVDKFRGN